MGETNSRRKVIYGLFALWILFRMTSGDGPFSIRPMDIIYLGLLGGAVYVGVKAWDWYWAAEGLDFDEETRHCPVCGSMLGAYSVKCGDCNARIDDVNSDFD